MKIETAKFEMSAGLASQFPPSTLPEIVFSGRSNVGKSSLINRLVNRKSLARTSSVPGKTATINFYHVDTMRLVDLPGYGYAKVAQGEKQRWADLIHSYFEDDRDIRLVIQLVDMRHPPTAQDFQMLDFMTYNHIPFVIALTKADKLKPNEREQRLKAIQTELHEFIDVKVIPFSIKSGEGVEELRNILDSAVQTD